MPKRFLLPPLFRFVNQVAVGAKKLEAFRVVLDVIQPLKPRAVAEPFIPPVHVFVVKFKRLYVGTSHSAVAVKPPAIGAATASAERFYILQP